MDPGLRNSAGVAKMQGLHELEGWKTEDPWAALNFDGRKSSELCKAHLLSAIGRSGNENPRPRLRLNTLFPLDFRDNFSVLLISINKGKAQIPDLKKKRLST